MTRHKKVILWMLLFTLWPLALWISYKFYYIDIEGRFIDLLFFAGLLIIVALFPIITGRYTIFLINGMTIVAFYTYGLFAEIILGQLALIVVIINTGILKRESFRLPLNMLSFMCISILSAEVFYLFGGQHGTMVYQGAADVYYIICYAISLFVVSELFNKMIDVLIYKKKIHMFDKGFRWELITLLLTLPVGFILYLLYIYLGNIGIIVVGVPFVFITITLKKTSSYREVNYFIKKAGEIGHELTKSLKVDHIYNVFMNSVVELLSVDYLYIYRVVDQTYLEVVRSYDVEKGPISSFIFVEADEGFSGMVWTLKKPVLYHDSKEWQEIYTPKIPKQTESVLSLPIEYGASITGVVTLISKEKKAFGKIHYRFLKVITNYLGVAIANAQNIESIKLKSETDGLTKLYNYEYFDQKIREYFEAMGSQTEPRYEGSLSLLLLDLDHFKRVNDRYGHEAGNQVLAQVAERLKKRVADLGILARYGGEEFILLLPNKDLFEAKQLAEDLRMLIADTPFTINDFLLGEKETIEISITTSVGVASYPSQCETPYELMSYADHAMYMGAKNKGRNKVAVYKEA